MFKDRSSFTYKPEEYLSGKTICVIDPIIEYKGKPEIIADKEDQIKVQQVLRIPFFVLFDIKKLNETNLPPFFIYVTSHVQML